MTKPPSAPMGADHSPGRAASSHHGPASGHHAHPGHDAHAGHDADAPRVEPPPAPPSAPPELPPPPPTTVVEVIYPPQRGAIGLRGAPPLSWEETRAPDRVVGDRHVFH
ncbi:MAG: hypothetical protein MUF34_33955, partial [Polyangiaceae bacterium]|nr:hypothetical protein [Polyangiaceae bacterium]